MRLKVELTRKDVLVPLGPHIWYLAALQGKEIQPHRDHHAVQKPKLSTQKLHEGREGGPGRCLEAPDSQVKKLFVLFCLVFFCFECSNCS